MNTSPHRRAFVATVCASLALGVMSACGAGAADDRATSVQKSADAVARTAKQDLRDGWEHTARDRHEMVLQEWRRQHPLSGATPNCG
jgi:hypothetical protein